MIKICIQLAVTLIFAAFVFLIGISLAFLVVKVLKITSVEDLMIWLFAVMVFSAPVWLILVDKSGCEAGKRG